MLGIIIGLCILLVMIIGMIWCRAYEKKLWNSGICAKCGTEWEYYDTDSHGGRGYKCKCEKLSDRYRCWISYSVDKRDI